MTQTYRYGGVSLLVILLAVAGLWPWVSSSARAGILFAALVAFAVQMIAFILLVRFWGEGKKFLLVWVGGTVVRMGVILLAALWVSLREAFPAAPTLLALAGFFFGLLLLEPLFLGAGRSESTDRL